MRWSKLSPYCIQSGAYKISKFSLGGRAIYGVWAGEELLGYYPNANEARKVAKKHSESREDV